MMPESISNLIDVLTAIFAAVVVLAVSIIAFKAGVWYLQNVANPDTSEYYDMWHDKEDGD